MVYRKRQREQLEADLDAASRAAGKFAPAPGGARGGIPYPPRQRPGWEDDSRPEPPAAPRIPDPAGVATMVLGGYLGKLHRAAGLPWNERNEQEIRMLILALIDAAKS